MSRARKIVAADLFCGAGGTSTGLAGACEALGLRLDLTAVNHWDRAVATHAANHPGARHLCETLDGVDPRKLFGRRPIDLLVASPECQGHSRAKGGTPLEDQSRATAWHVVRWADALRPRAVLVENVPEFRKWGPLGADGRPLKRRQGETFAAWLGALESLGYAADHRVVNCADHGDATTRERLFVLALRGRRAPSWPEPSHQREPAADLYSAPRPRWRAAREVIDWTLRGESIFTRKRPLKDKTLARIEAGLRRFGGAEFVVKFKGTAPDQIPATACDPAAPLGTLTGGSNYAPCEPFLIPYRGERAGQEPRTHSASDPMPTVTTEAGHALVEPSLMHATHHGGPRVHGIDAPVPTVTGAHRGELAFIMSYYGTDQGPRDLGCPLDTVTTKDRFALIELCRRAGANILFRMLQPHELAAAHSFPPGYVFSGSRTDRVRQIGNSVPVRTSEALCRALLAA